MSNETETADSVAGAITKAAQSIVDVCRASTAQVLHQGTLEMIIRDALTPFLAAPPDSEDVEAA